MEGGSGGRHSARADRGLRLGGCGTLSVMGRSNTSARVFRGVSPTVRRPPSGRASGNATMTRPSLEWVWILIAWVVGRAVGCGAPRVGCQHGRITKRPSVAMSRWRGAGAHDPHPAMRRGGRLNPRVCPLSPARGGGGGGQAEYARGQGDSVHSGRLPAGGPVSRHDPTKSASKPGRRWNKLERR